LPRVRVVVCNAIGLLRSWELQEDINWALQREANVMFNLIAGFRHQICFVDEILTPKDNCTVATVRLARTSHSLMKS
jgi:short-subunit dehydrogenase involved in D-alanine esterification of teichoic acids